MAPLAVDAVIDTSELKLTACVLIVVLCLVLVTCRTIDGVAVAIIRATQDVFGKSQLRSRQKIVWRFARTRHGIIDFIGWATIAATTNEILTTCRNSVGRSRVLQVTYEEGFRIGIWRPIRKRNTTRIGLNIPRRPLLVCGTASGICRRELTGRTRVRHPKIIRTVRRETHHGQREKHRYAHP